MKDDEVHRNTNEKNQTSSAMTSFEDDLVVPNPLPVECGTWQKNTPESNSTWGDFESFSEFTPQTEQFHYTNEELSGVLQSDSTVMPSHLNTAFQEDDFSELIECHTGPQGCLAEDSTSTFEDIFKASFPSMPVNHSDEDVQSLRQLMAASNDKSADETIQTQLWPASINLERVGEVSADKPGCEWEQSRGYRNLLHVLGVEASGHSLVDGNQTLNNLICNDSEMWNENRSVNPTGNRALIQTKLHVAPDSKQGHIFSYQLFLKKAPAEITLPFLTFYGKKSFFNTNFLRLNF
ncbi:uncharacterized protein CLBA1-like [Pelodytes ibericus]